ncbi:hypothetical protein ACM5Q9_03790 [Advenella sp. RU8]|uniref:hypothetical protein n=1 Tax=Advenella sp. RU8 TaxID=3399575 RepID=UPI003AAEB73D
MRPDINNQEMDEATKIQKQEAPLEPNVEEWAKNNLSWLSQTEYQRYINLLEKEANVIDTEKMFDDN